MENVAPLLQLCTELRFLINSGQSLRSSLYKLTVSRDKKLQKQLKEFLAKISQGESLDHITLRDMSFLRRSFFIVLERGFRGEPVEEALLHIEQELVQESHHQINQFLQALPYKLLIPVMLFQFPAYLGLFFGPALKQLLLTFQ